MSLTINFMLPDKLGSSKFIKTPPAITGIDLSSWDTFCECNKTFQSIQAFMESMQDSEKAYGIWPDLDQVCKQVNGFCLKMEQVKFTEHKKGYGVAPKIKLSDRR